MYHKTKQIRLHITHPKHVLVCAVVKCVLVHVCINVCATRIMNSYILCPYFYILVKYFLLGRGVAEVAVQILST